MTAANDPRTPDDIAGHVAQLLDQLAAGGTADSVAQVLRAAGVKDARRRCSRCPVAVWLRQQTGLAVEIDGKEAYVFPAGGHAPVAVLRVPAAVVEFVGAIDALDAYPDLIGALS